MLGDRLDVGVKAGRGRGSATWGLQNRSWYYRIDFGTTESILVLQNRFWYYRIDFGTTESNLVLQNRFRYYRGDLGTTESILVLHNRYRVTIEGSEWALEALRGGFRAPEQAQKEAQRAPERVPNGAS